MANFFDQFDAPVSPAPKAAPPAASGNFFDQFDAPAAAAPSARSTGEVTAPKTNPFTPDTTQDRALTALAPFFERGVAARNSAGQWTDEARARLTKEGIDPLTLDQKGERDLQAKWDVTQRTGSDAAAVGRGLLNGIPIAGPAVLGGVNRTAAFIRAIQNGTPYSDELKNVEAFGERTAAASPKSTVGGELAGGVLGTAPLVAAAPAAFGAGTGSLLARSAASLASGGAIGGADAAARGQDIDTGAITGAALGGAAPAVAAGIGRGIGAIANRARPTPVPTTADLKSGAQAAYRAAEDAGVQISAPAFAQGIQDLGAAVKSAGFNAKLYPKAAAVLEELNGAVGSSPTLQDVELLRRVAKGAAGSNEAAERRIGTIIIEKLDDITSGLKPDDVVTGDAAAAVGSLADARDLWSRYSKSRTLETGLDRAERRAATAGTGGNANNATRQNIRRILDNPKLAAAYTADELDQMEAIVRGGSVQNALRLIGKLSPQTGALQTLGSLAAAAHDPKLAIFPAVGTVAKALADRGTSVGVKRLAEAVRNGAPVEESAAAIAARQKAEELARSILAPAPALANQWR